ncbi:MAG: putative manganese-dependent inorganic diphosphatase [Opitutae bacterium]|nr:putative manganese-dependent inorganic diphosphatase [Opitutae bacterium]MCD8298366.1 putative manganese-dependent inorganic diphosphatase [Opitutae bacterium]
MDTTSSAKRIFVSGHKNPDIDSVASAYALAELRNRQSGAEGKFIPICPGIISERAAFLFKKFGLEPPQTRHDVYVRMRDLIEKSPEISAGTTLFDAVKSLRESQMSQLPVIDENRKYLGMLSPLALLSQLLNVGREGSDDLVGRKIYSSIELICRVLEAKPLTLRDAQIEQTFEVYVAAMRSANFDAHLPVKKKNLAVIVGDRPEIHQRALAAKIRLVIVTGKADVATEIVRDAKARGVSIIKTSLDSATVIRRLKFGMPVEHAQIAAASQLTLSPDDKLRDFRKKILRSPDEFSPVIDAAGTLLGVVYKKQLSEPPPFAMILVDHNEPTQFLAGAEELPIIEVVDHHRINLFSSAMPLKFTSDAVGSTCTLVAQMFRDSGEKLPAPIAGILLGGVISDTLVLKSPTTSPRDREICAWLESICGVSAEALMSELMRIGSALAKESATHVVCGDRKDYVDGGIKFALSQVEETNFELLRSRKKELLEQMRFRLEVENLAFFGLLVTNAVRETSVLLICGDNDVLDALPYEKLEDSLYLLPDVLSRKKQLLPQILAVVNALHHD